MKRLFSYVKNFHTKPLSLEHLSKFSWLIQSVYVLLENVSNFPFKNQVKTEECDKYMSIKMH